MKQWLQILSEEKERILNMHLDATKKNYLSEQTEPPQLDLATYRKNCLNYVKNKNYFKRAVVFTMQDSDLTTLFNNVSIIGGRRRRRTNKRRRTFRRKRMTKRRR